MQNESTPATPASAHDAWAAAALKSLKGATLESLTVRTVEGLQIAPLYDSAPETGAVRADAVWDIRAPIRAADPAEANRLAHEALGGGTTSVLLDLGGLGSAADLRAALDGVVIEAAPVALDAGLHGALAAEWLAESGAVGPAARAALHLDPLGAFAVAGQSPGPIEEHVRVAAKTAAKLAERYPQACLFLASGRAAHEAGGSAGHELGMAAAAAVAYARAMADAGLGPEVGISRIALGLSVDAEVLVSVAKLRAARRIWARIAAACGQDVPAVIEARSSDRMLTAADPWTNLLRQTLAGFAGAVGGADALALGAFTDALGRPAERARRLACNTQLILMEEASLGRLADPAAGAWALESLTDQLARQGWSFFQAIERQGGLAGALTSGFIAAEVAEVRAARAAEIAEGDRPILGVTVFPDPEPLPVEVEAAAPHRALPDVRVPGPDSGCPPLTPIRLSAAAEGVSGDLAS